MTELSDTKRAKACRRTQYFGISRMKPAALPRDFPRFDSEADDIRLFVPQKRTNLRARLKNRICCLPDTYANQSTQGKSVLEEYY